MRDFRHASHTSPSFELDDDVKRLANQAADRRVGQLDTALQHARSKSRERLLGGVGVNCWHAARVAGTGKTTLLNALATLLPESDRIVLIEDTAELTIAHPNLVRFEARREQPDTRAVTIRDLLRATLRHRPDRIIDGEVRAGEAFDLRQTLNTPVPPLIKMLCRLASATLVRFTKVA
jgi:hypothetical protein